MKGNKNKATNYINYLQSGAGHHLESGSDNRTRLTIKSSYFFITVGDVRNNVSISLGCIASVHCGHAISVRDSNISMVK